MRTMVAVAVEAQRGFVLREAVEVAMSDEDCAADQRSRLLGLEAIVSF